MLELLKRAGLNGYESRVYMALLQNGELDAKSVSERSNIPPTAVYPNLKSLKSKGLIQELAGKVSVYQALPPESALSAYLEEQKKALTGLKEKLVAESGKLSFQNLEKKEAVHLSYGQEFSEHIYLESLARAKKTYYVLGWTFRTIGNKYTNLQKFKEKIQKEKLDMRVIITGEAKQKDLIKAYLDAGVKMRYYPLQNFSIFVVDEKECKITLKGHDLAHRYNIQVLDQNLARALQSYFLQVWAQAAEVSKKGKLALTSSKWLVNGKN